MVYLVSGSSQAQHATQISTPPHFSRAIPLLVVDYCFLKNSSDQDLITVLVARLYPARALFAVQSDMKGNDPYTVTRLATFIKHSGIEHCVYMCDQETPIDAMMQASLSIVGKQGSGPALCPSTVQWVNPNRTAEPNDLFRNSRPR